MEEPLRRSVLDHTRDAKKENLCRLIFCARLAPHCQNVGQLFHCAIHDRSPSVVTGLLLVRSNFAIHLLEASEDDIFQICNETFARSQGAITSTKCLYIQNSAEKRFFKKWYAKKMKNSETEGDGARTQLYREDNFETASALYERTIFGLHKLYKELWRTCALESYENFIKRLDLVTTEGHSHIPLKADVDFILESRWGYDLIALAKDYRNLKYPYDFDDSSTVSEIVQEMCSNASARANCIKALKIE